MQQVQWALVLTTRDAGSWAPSQQQEFIAYRELFPVVAATMSGGPDGASKFFFHLNNDAVVHMLNPRTSQIPSLMHLLHNQLFSSASDNFSFSAYHIPGVSNNIADALSCFHRQELHPLAPDAQPPPTFYYWSS